MRQMANFVNNSIPFTSGFVDETSTDLQVDEQTIPLDSFLSDPLLVDNNICDSSEASTHFQEDRLDNVSGVKFQEENLEIESNTKFQEDNLETEPNTKFQENNLETEFNTKFQQDNLETESNTMFQEGSLVFAKLSGHSDPPWPARVAKLCWKRHILYGYEVFFYGTYQVGIVLTDKVWAYNEESLAKFSKPKIASLRKRGDFSRGLTEICDCPDIAPSRNIQESASQIAKKLIRSSATNNDQKVPRKRANSVGVVATLTPDRSNREVKDRGDNQRMGSKITGIKKIQDKNKPKPSSWILSPIRKQDSSSDDDDEIHPTKKMKLPSNVENENTSTRGKNITRRSKRVKKVPYWKRFEDNKVGVSPQNTPKKDTSLDQNTPKKDTSLDHGIQNIRLQNQNEPKSTYRLRNANKSVASKAAKEKTDSKREKANSLNLNTPNYRSKLTETTPRPLKKPGENGKTPVRRAATVDTGGREEVLQQPKLNAKVRQSSFSILRRARSLQPVEVDCRIVKEELLSENPREWTVAQTVSSIIRMDPSIEQEDIQPIREHKIDGSALIQFSFHDFVTYCKIKAGPAMKISNIVKTLKASTQNL